MAGNQTLRKTSVRRKILPKINPFEDSEEGLVKGIPSGKYIDLKNKLNVVERL